MLHLDHCNDAHAKMACYVCSDPNNVVDTEAMIDYEGVLAICVRCLTEMARCAGLPIDGPSQAMLDHEIIRADTAERRARSAEDALGDLRDAATAAQKRHRERERRASR